MSLDNRTGKGVRGKADATCQIGGLERLNISWAQVTLDGLSPAAVALGWSVDTLKVALAAGERKPITVTCVRAWVCVYASCHATIPRVPNLYMPSRFYRRTVSGVVH